MGARSNASTGSSISSLIAKTALHRLESLLFRYYRPRFCLQYVDGTLVVIERGQVPAFREHLKAVCPDAQFTVDEKENNQLAFFEVIDLRKDSAEMVAEQRCVGSPYDEDVSGLQLQDLPLTTDNGTILHDVSITYYRPYVPISLHRNVSSSLHDLPQLRSRATDKLVSDHFIWPRMYKDFKAWTRACICCQRGKVQRHNKAPIGIFPTPDTRFNHAHLNIRGTKTCIQRGTREWVERLDCIKAAVADTSSGNPVVTHSMLHLPYPLFLCAVYSPPLSSSSSSSSSSSMFATSKCHFFINVQHSSSSSSTLILFSCASQWTSCSSPRPFDYSCFLDMNKLL
ncbi:hypothetical protein SprV_0301115700 [Sparganum proliferum]